MADPGPCGLEVRGITTITITTWYSVALSFATRALSSSTGTHRLEAASYAHTSRSGAATANRVGDDAHEFERQGVVCCCAWLVRGDVLGEFLYVRSYGYYEQDLHAAQVQSVDPSVHRGRPPHRQRDVDHVPRCWSVRLFRALHWEEERRRGVWGWTRGWGS